MRWSLSVFLIQVNKNLTPEIVPASTGQLCSYGLEYQRLEDARGYHVARHRLTLRAVAEENIVIQLLPHIRESLALTLGENAGMAGKVNGES